MKELTNAPDRPGPLPFDFATLRRIVSWMNPLRLKAYHGFAAIVSVTLFLVGCETTEGDTVPKRTATAEVPTTVVTSPAPVQYTAAPAPAPRAIQVAQASDQAPPPTVSAPSNTSTNAENLEIKQVVPPATPGNLNISEGVQKVIKLAEAHSDEAVMTAFVSRYPTRFDMDADEILYLSDLGVPSTVVAAMLKHDGDDPNRAMLTNAPNTENVQPALPAQAAAPAPIQGSQVISQQPTEVTANYGPANAVVQQPVVVQQQPQTVVVQPQPQVVYAQPESVSMFYDSLSPYGSWMYVTDYGWCWQPTVATVDVGWRPYGPQGRWLWTDNGWYWNSYYTWGWAPFHYGRWTFAHRHGWVWVPDTVWGPSWVTWRSSGDYCGWAPLPPSARFVPGVGFYFHGRSVDVGFGFGLGYDAFCFTPTRFFYDPHPFHHFIPRHEVRDVWSHARVENRFEVHRDRFVNNGIPHDRVAAASHQEIRPAAVRETPRQDTARFGARERVEHTGREEVVYRPNLNAAAAAATTSANAPRRVAPAQVPTGVANVAPIRRDGRSEVSGRSGIVATPTPAPAPSAATSTVNREMPTRTQPTGRSTVATTPSAPVRQAPTTPAPNATAPRSAGPGTAVDPATRRPVENRASVPTVTAPNSGTRLEASRAQVVAPTTPAPRVEVPPRVQSPPVTSSIQTPVSRPAPQITAPTTPAPAPRYEPPQHVTRQNPVVTMPQPGPGMVRPPVVSQPSAPPVQRTAPPAAQPSQGRGQGRDSGGGGGRNDRRGRD